MISIEQFRHDVAALDSTALETGARKRRFMVHVRDNGLDFLPEASGLPRSESWDAIATVLDRFNETGSLRPKDYQKESFNSSYILTVLRRIIS